MKEITDTWGDPIGVALSPDKGLVVLKAFSAGNYILTPDQAKQLCYAILGVVSEIEGHKKGRLV